MLQNFVSAENFSDKFHPQNFDKFSPKTTYYYLPIVYTNFKALCFIRKFWPKQFHKIESRKQCESLNLLLYISCTYSISFHCPELSISVGQSRRKLKAFFKATTLQCRTLFTATTLHRPGLDSISWPVHSSSLLCRWQA
jgi:hypothetical protein